MKPVLLIVSALSCLNSGYGKLENSDLAEIVATLQGSDYDARFKARMTLQDHVSEASSPGNEAVRAEIEAKLVSLLEADFPTTTRLWLIRQLNSIGSEASVNSLAALLGDGNVHIADGARMALQMNTSSRATAALIAGLGKASGSERVIGFLSSLSQRGGKSAIAAIVPYLSNGDLDIATAAVTALKELKADDALETFYPRAPKSAKALVELALLERTTDFGFCKELAKNGGNSAVQVAAFRRSIALSSGKASKLFASLVSSSRQKTRSALLRAALLSGKSNVARAGLALIEESDPAQQAVIVASLGSIGPSRNSEKAILALGETENEALKLQVIEALGEVGGVSSLPWLMEALELRSRDLSGAAAHAIASLGDQRVDRKLMASAADGEDGDRIAAINVLSYRNSDGAAALVNQIAAGDASVAVREQAVEAMERIGDGDSLKVLVDLIVGEEGTLRKVAQKTLKRVSSRMGDPDTVWSAMREGFEAANGDGKAKNALLLVSDSAPTPGAIDFFRSEWSVGGKTVRRDLLRVLPGWKNWDGGFLMLEFAKGEGLSDSLRDACFSGIGRLILSSNANASTNVKFDLANKSLAIAETEKQRQAILSGFRNASSRDVKFAKGGDVDPALKKLLLP